VLPNWRGIVSIRFSPGEGMLVLTYVFHPKELVTPVFSDRPCILQHLLERSDLWFWFRIFLVLR
jgi:hypothetical protein